MRNSPTPEELRLAAMRHLEQLLDGQSRTAEAIVTRLCAAHYLLQAMGSGPRPSNYAEVLTAAHALDAEEMTGALIHLLKARAKLGPPACAGAAQFDRNQEQANGRPAAPH